GEVASAIFADTVRELFGDSGECDGEETAGLVAESFRLANERIVRMSEDQAQHHGMGCTAELIAFHGDHYVLGHVGDSRSYLYREGVLSQVTKDHSLIQEQVDQGLITPHQARNHTFKNVILRAVGVEEALSMDLLRGECLPGDLFLLCSDGLSDMVEDERIADALGRRLTLAQKADRLVELAKIGGGRDNITVVLCEVSSP
ncbi:MAG: protein phosphatase 2C domain-containing protein, partial [Deltaproteobacteria bacterium]|nr:protein phosphatase 2C domain-containing protein [Deltaproteobacteria bacterium]